MSGATWALIGLGVFVVGDVAIAVLKHRRWIREFERARHARREWERNREELAEEVVRVAFRVTGAGVAQLAEIYRVVRDWRPPPGGQVETP